MFGLDLPEFIRAIGYLGVFGIVFAESGLMVGFFLPGDSLLFTAGILASQGYLNIWLLCTLLFIAAVLGDNAGYWIGRRLGVRLFNRDRSFIFNKKNIARSQSFFHRHGTKTIIIARFVPVVRTFAAVIAGVGKMDYRLFFFFDIVGGLLWAVGITLLGYFLGLVVPNIELYIIPGIIIIILLSITPSFVQFIKNPAARAEFDQLLHRIKNRFRPKG
jgi:membrane-associated protein